MSQQQRKPKRVAPNLFQRGATWYFRKVVGDKRVSVSTKQQDYTLAVIARDALMTEVNKGTLAEFIERKKPGQASPTFTAWAAAYLRDVSKRVTQDTQNTAPAVAFFGDKRLDKITVLDCEHFLGHLRSMKHSRGGKFTECSIHKHVMSCSKLLNRAVLHGLIKVNPWRDVDKKLKPNWEARSRVLTVGEQDAFDKAATPELRRVFRVMLGTGVRREELISIVAAKHLDFANNVLRLSSDIVKGKKKARSIPMQPAVVEAFAEQIAARKDHAVGHGHGRPRDDLRLFNVAKCTLNLWLIDTIKEMGATPFTLHDCRRTFGSRCADAGVPMSVLQDWMGHSDITTTRTFYVHGNEESSQRHMAAVNIGLPAAKVVAFKQKEQEKS